MNKQSNNTSKWILVTIGGIILLSIVFTVLSTMSIKIHSPYVGSLMYRFKQARYYSKRYQRGIQKMSIENGLKGRVKITDYYADHTKASTNVDIQVTYNRKVSSIRNYFITTSA